MCYTVAKFHLTFLLTAPERCVDQITYYGKWLPSDQEYLNIWMEELISEVENKDREYGVDASCEGQEIPNLHPPIKDLKYFIESDPAVNMYFHQMFDQVNVHHQMNPVSHSQVRDYCMLLRLLNRTMTKAPEFSTKGLIGLPISTIFVLPMGTVGGHTAFLNDKVNAHFKEILNYWGEFLKSPESCNVLNDDPRKGWFGQDAMNAMEGFAEDFICDASKPHYGFASWDDFFTRQFREGRRPVASPNDSRIIINACESSTYNIQFNVQRQDQFWIKTQPYSLQFMLNNDQLAENFVGGTVYQAYLSSLSYHHWHSPVDGVIRKAYVVEGSYFSGGQFPGFALVGSQAYLTAVAARAIIVIEADNKYIGLMAFLAVGMIEVSSTEIIVQEGQHVKKGQQIGMFHYGGSSYCLIFRPSVDIEFVFKQQKIGLYSPKVIPINSKIASVSHSG